MTLAEKEANRKEIVNRHDELKKQFPTLTTDAIATRLGLASKFTLYSMLRKEKLAPQ